jgi:hypothetical protein
MEYIGAVIAGIFLIVGIFVLHYAGLGIGAWQQYRAGKAEDETPEWQAFKDAFEVKK